MFKKLIFCLLIALCLLSVFGCKDGASNLKSANIAIANKDYELAVNYLRIAKQKDAKSFLPEIVEKLKITEGYLAAKKSFAAGDYGMCLDELNAIPGSYSAYAIKDDIDPLKTEVQGKITEEKETVTASYDPPETSNVTQKIVVLDAGHGKPSSLMSEQEKLDAGYSKNGGFGEWRHYKSGTFGVECEGSGCNQNHTCWYPIGSGDRNTEPEINLQNVLAAKKYLEQYGYTVRLTRSSNDENPSFSKRVSYCFKDNDTSAPPDALCYVCVHTNAGGGRGTAYIKATSGYDQKYISSDYAEKSNEFAKTVNDSIVENSSLPRHGDGSIGGEGYLILFNKCPVLVAYLEIGFYDSSDLDIIKSEHDRIGKGIADGINNYFENNL